MSNATGLLKRALEELEIHGEVSTWDLIKEISAFLAAEPEADEPTDILTIAYQLGYQEGKKFRPEPARKPMTEEEINRELPFECSGIYFDGFRDGIDFAEKHHGIGGDDT